MGKMLGTWIHALMQIDIHEQGEGKKMEKQIKKEKKKKSIYIYILKSITWYVLKNMIWCIKFRSYYFIP